MFDQLIKRSNWACVYKMGRFAEERRAFLYDLNKQGHSLRTLRNVNKLLLAIAERVNVRQAGRSRKRRSSERLGVALRSHARRVPHSKRARPQRKDLSLSPRIGSAFWASGMIRNAVPSSGQSSTVFLKSYGTKEDIQTKPFPRANQH